MWSSMYSRHFSRFFSFQERYLHCLHLPVPSIVSGCLSLASVFLNPTTSVRLIKVALSRDFCCPHVTCPSSKPDLRLNVAGCGLPVHLRSDDLEGHRRAFRDGLCQAQLSTTIHKLNLSLVQLVPACSK